MRIIKKTMYQDLRKKYDVLIGWGAGVEFQKYYNPMLLKLDAVIDGGNKNIGTIKNGILIQGIEAVGQYAEHDSVLVIIYPNIENEIILQVQQLLPKADTIVARLLDIEGQENTNSADREDSIMYQYIMSKYSEFSYLDIGVCHPVVRNNTYLFYERGQHEGVLVEPNAEMCRLAQEYRPDNKILNVGAAPLYTEEKLTYYYDSQHPGLNTFLKEVAESRKMEKNYIKVPVVDINTIIEKNFKTYPNILDIDTEGMDYQLLDAIDYEAYPIDVICAERGKGISKLMEQKGYILLEATYENEIYVRRSLK